MNFIRSEGTNWMYSCPNQQKELTVAWITKEKRDKLKPGKSQHIDVRNITPAIVLIVCGSGSCLTSHTRAL